MRKLSPFPPSFAQAKCLTRHTPRAPPPDLGSLGGSTCHGLPAASVVFPAWRNLRVNIKWGQPFPLTLSLRATQTSLSLTHIP